MKFIDALNVSASGLTAQRARMNVIAENLANINTTRTVEGGPYRRKDVVFSSVQTPTPGSFQAELEKRATQTPGGVRLAAIIEDPRPPVIRFDPNHPDADENGYVQLPNVNIVEEMVNMISATRAYEANVTAAQATKDMARTALDIGR